MGGVPLDRELAEDEVGAVDRALSLTITKLDAVDTSELRFACVVLMSRLGSDAVLDKLVFRVAVGGADTAAPVSLPNDLVGDSLSTISKFRSVECLKDCTLRSIDLRCIEFNWDGFLASCEDSDEESSSSDDVEASSPLPLENKSGSDWGLLMFLCCNVLGEYCGLGSAVGRL